MNKPMLLVIPALVMFICNTDAQENPGPKTVYRNLALSSSVSVSSMNEGLIGENLIDGDTLTRWASQFKDNEWIMLDLKNAFIIDKILLRWEVAFAREYILQVSADGEYWTNIIDRKNGDGKTDVISAPAILARYIKLQCIKRATKFGFSLWEIEVYSHQHLISIIDSFDDSLLTGWTRKGNCYLKNENNALKATWKPASPGRYTGQFQLLIKNGLFTKKYPNLSFKANSAEKAPLIIRCRYNHNVFYTVHCTLKDDKRWHIYSFSLDSLIDLPLKDIQFSIGAIPGINKPLEILMDDITIGNQGKMPVTDKDMLLKLVDMAKKYLRSSAEEKDIREFTEGALTHYQSEIQASDEVLKDPDMAQIEIDRAADRLIIANAAIETSVIIPQLPLQTCNPYATLETQYLYNNMKSVEGRSVFFGQMDPFYLNNESTGKLFQSDVEDICGSLPAVGSWELKNISLGLGYSAISEEIEYYYTSNGIISFCWHMMDPAGKSFYLKDLADKYAGNELLPGGKYYNWYLTQLDRIAFFFQQLKGPGGESVPILFRPFHEMDGDWFWWGKPYVSPETFAKLWQFTFNYMVKVKKINNLLFVFSPCDRFKTREGKDGYLDYYPGDSYVDILAQDNYWQVRSGADSAAFVKQLRIMTELAAEKNKISGISETGLAELKIHDWFTAVLLKPIKSDSLAGRITYFSIWNHEFVPYPGHPSANDFLKFYNDPVTFFIGDYPDLYHSLIKN